MPDDAAARAPASGRPASGASGTGPLVGLTRVGLTLLATPLAACRLDGAAPVPVWAGLDRPTTALVAVVRRADETTVVCRADAVPEPVPDGVRVEGPLRAFVVDGPLPFDVIGVAAALTGALAAARVPVLPLATFDTDVLLVAARHVRRARRALDAAGHAVRDERPPLRFATTSTHVGRLLAAVTPAGLAWAALGDTDDALADDLVCAFADHAAERDDAALAPVLAALVRTLDGTPYAGPLDVRGTPFQQRVWAVLRRLPFGETATYADIADALDVPGGARAVGSAVGANPVALAIPCHRAVRGDGRPTPFRWGTPRKDALLAHERGGQLSLFDAP